MKLKCDICEHIEELNEEGVKAMEKHLWSNHFNTFITDGFLLWMESVTSKKEG